MDTQDDDINMAPDVEHCPCCDAQDHDCHCYPNTASGTDPDSGPWEDTYCGIHGQVWG